VASFLHRKTQFMDLDQTVFQLRAGEFFISKFGIGIITVTSKLTISGADNQLTRAIYVVCLKSSVNGTRKETKQKIQTN
jgi:hypothetical protein